MGKKFVDGCISLAKNALWPKGWVLAAHACTNLRLVFALQRGEIEFEVVYVAPEVDSDDENVEYEDDSGHRYRLYLDELEEASASSHGNGPAELATLQGKFSP